MAFLRRGKVTFPHKGQTAVTLTRNDGAPFYLRLVDLNCWEEHEFSHSLAKVVIVYHGLSSTTVRETFDAVAELVNGKAVTP